MKTVYNISNKVVRVGNICILPKNSYSWMNGELYKAIEKRILNLVNLRILKMIEVPDPIREKLYRPAENHIEEKIFSDVHLEVNPVDVPDILVPVADEGVQPHEQALPDAEPIKPDEKKTDKKEAKKSEPKKEADKKSDEKKTDKKEAKKGE